MNWKKIYSITLILTFVFTVPLTTQVFAEEENEEENSEEIIEREDIPTNEDIPDPPKDESLIGDEENVHEVEIETPSSVTGEKMEGAGTVVDFSTTGARAFYTIVDDDNNTFYLMIDMDKADNNVYFLSDINKEELASGSSTTEDNDNTGFLGNNKDNEEPENEEENIALDNEEPEKEDESSNLSFLIMVASIGLIGAFAYYFFVLKRKQNDNRSDELGEDEDEDERMLTSYEDEDVYSDGGFYEEESEEKQEDESDNR